MPASLLRQFVQVLLMGEALSLRSTLAEGASVDDPTLGRVFVDGLSRLGALWRDRGAARDPRWIGMTVTPSRVVGEFEIDVQGPDGPVALPVTAVAEPGEGASLSAVRLYHSFWPIRGAHTLRKPVMACDDAVTPGDVVGRYQAALADGDVDGVLASFAADGCAREPAGGEWVHCGQDELRGFYGALLSTGGIPLRHCTITDDGTRCAIEYVVDRIGSAAIPAQAGVAVYERAGDLLRAARIYDDIDIRP